LNLYLVFIFSIILFLLRIARSQAIEERVRIEVMLCAVFIFGFLAASFFDFPRERIEHMVWFNIMLAVACTYIYKYSDITHFRTTKLSSAVNLLMLILLAVISTIGILRYKGEYYTRQMYAGRYAQQEQKAIEAGNKALSFTYCIDPTSVPLHWYMANAYVNLKDYEKAQHAFLVAYKNNPYHRNVVNDLGSSFSMSNKDSLAKKYYREALRISPRFDDPKLNLAAVYIREKNWEGADTCLRAMFHDSERRSQYQKMVNAFLGK